MPIAKIVLIEPGHRLSKVLDFKLMSKSVLQDDLTQERVTNIHARIYRDRNFQIETEAF